MSFYGTEYEHIESEEHLLELIAKQKAKQEEAEQKQQQQSGQAAKKAGLGSSKDLDADQTVRDEQGRRRFHGAFTGGFSAGYFNTVATPEGWTPQQFKSTRAERQKIQQKPTDYMDEEDLEEMARMETSSKKPMSAYVDEHLIEKNLEGKKRKLAASGAEPLATVVGGKRFEFKGEAFGTGALDEDDDDVPVYSSASGMLTSYDISLPLNRKERKKETKHADKRLASEMEGSSKDLKMDAGTRELCWDRSFKDNLEAYKTVGDLVKGRKDPDAQQLKKEKEDQSKPAPSSKPRMLPPPKPVQPGLMKPLHGFWASKFVRGVDPIHNEDVKPGLATQDQITSKLQEGSSNLNNKGTTGPVKLPLGSLKRTSYEWHPDNILCRRFNVPNPYPHIDVTGVVIVGNTQETVVNRASEIYAQQMISAKYTTPAAHNEEEEDSRDPRPPEMPIIDKILSHEPSNLPSSVIRQEHHYYKHERKSRWEQPPPSTSSASNDKSRLPDIRLVDIPLPAAPPPHLPPPALAEPSKLLAQIDPKTGKSLTDILREKLKKELKTIPTDKEEDEYGPAPPPRNHHSNSNHTDARIKSRSRSSSSSSSSSGSSERHRRRHHGKSSKHHKSDRHARRDHHSHSRSSSSSHHMKHHKHRKRSH